MKSKNPIGYGFESLGKVGQALVKLLAVIGQPITNTNLQKCYKQASFLGHPSVPMVDNVERFKLNLKEIQKLKLANSDLYINQKIVNRILTLIEYSGEKEYYVEGYKALRGERGRLDNGYEGRELYKISKIQFALWMKDKRALEISYDQEPDPEACITVIDTLVSMFYDCGNTEISKDSAHFERISYLPAKIPTDYMKQIDGELRTILEKAILITAAAGNLYLDDYVCDLALKKYQDASNESDFELPLFILLNAEKLPKDLKSDQITIHAAYSSILKGDVKSASGYFKKYRIAKIKGQTTGRNLPLPGIIGPLMAYFEIILDFKTSKKIEKSLGSANYQYEYGGDNKQIFSHVANAVSSESFRFHTQIDSIREPYIPSGYFAATGLGYLICLQHFFNECIDLSEKSKDIALKGFVEEAIDALRSHNFIWLANELSQASQNLGLETQLPKLPPTKINDSENSPTCLKPNSLPEEWEKDLENLKNLTDYKENEGDGKRKKTNAVMSTRISWFLTDNLAYLTPKLQTQRKDGSWSMGKIIGLKTVSDTGLPDCATAIDHQIIKSIHWQDQGWRAGRIYSLESKPVVSELAIHPNVYTFENPESSLRFSLIDPELSLTREDEKIEVFVKDEIKDLYQFGMFLDNSIPNQINTLAPFSKAKEKYISNFISSPLIFPEDKLDKFYPVLLSIQKTVKISGIDQIEKGLLKKIKPNTNLTCRLLVTDETLHFEFAIDPFPRNPTGSTKAGNRDENRARNFFRPSEGEAVQYSSVNGDPCRCERDFKAETASWENIKKIISKTLQSKEENISYRFKLDIINGETLEFLEEMKALQTSNELEIEWQDEKNKIETRTSEKPIKIEIDSSKTSTDWFEVSGSLKIDKTKVLEFEVILDGLLKSGSRFINLGNNQFLALTQEIAEKLRVFGRIRSSNKTKDLPPSAILALQSLADSSLIEIDCSDQWKKKIESFDPKKIKPKKVPKKFNATLRPYQTEGLNWLQKMGEYGFGACLADDMGLGKTIQCLALVSIRHKKGPTLVVAPTSLTFNWMLETEKFCPMLKPIFLTGNHKLSDLPPPKAGEIYFTSYGQLVSDREELSSVRWNTLILDECQSIKNPQTQRAKAARELNADFRIGLSGTPIENHLGELWSLFHFLNPGLLGELKYFKNLYAGKGANKDIMTSLNQMIEPFLLRRIKKDVLSDLPDKIEKTLVVPPNKNEAAFYEALRTKLVERLEKLEPNQRYIESLAALMKLRRAACHPSLIDPELEISSAKHEALHALLEEVIGNGHQVLVFSQFVGHLDIVQNHLEENEISFQRIDGRTPVKKRQASVEAFQKGDGDVFLISLKAGGFGLNLTAADHVIHLDPWWNPAVEDQASDRSHRIGQTRTVNVYRIVTQGSIEEKILSLHTKKRDLTDQILSNKAKASSFSGDELFSLLSSGGAKNTDIASKNTGSSQKTGRRKGATMQGVKNVESDQNSNNKDLILRGKDLQ